jgi:hypothetical protein
MTSHPVCVGDGGVEPLLKHWGGEVASMWVRDEALLSPLPSSAVPASSNSPCPWIWPIAAFGLPTPLSHPLYDRVAASQTSLPLT